MVIMAVSWPQAGVAVKKMIENAPGYVSFYPDAFKGNHHPFKLSNFYS
jgi:hypothetical protein